MKKQNLGILIRCCLCVVGSVGMVSNCIGIFFTPFADSLNAGIGRISVIVMVTSIATAVSSLIFARLQRQLPLKVIMIIGVLLTTGAFLMMSVARSLWVLYTANVLLGLGAGFYGTLAVSVILRETYGEKNGTALGIALASSGIVGALINPVLAQIISRSSYVSALRVLALLMALLCLPSVATLTVAPTASKENRKNVQRVSLKEMQIPLATLVILFICAASFYTQNGMNTHISSLAVSTGYSLEFSSFVVSGVMIANTLFKLMFGALADRIGPFWATKIYLCIGVCGTLSMLLLRNIPAFMIIGPFLYGCNFSCSTIGSTLMAQQIGKEHYPDIYARMTVLTTMAYATGTTVYGFLRDSFNSYQPALMTVVCLACLAFVLTSVLQKRANPSAKN